MMQLIAEASRIAGRRSRAAASLAAVILAASALVAGCGGGGGDAPKAPESAPLYIKSFSQPNYSGVYLDEDLVFRLSAPVKEESINPDSLQIRTGATGGIAPFGVFVRGEVLTDDFNNGNRVVINPQGASENLINRVERSGDLTRMPDTARIDLGFDEPGDDGVSNGGRLPLFDRSSKAAITFVPEVPTRAALDDTGYTGGSVYTISIPGYPSTNTLANLSGAQLLNPNNRVFTSTFTTVPATSPGLFLASETAGLPRIIHSDPFNGTAEVDVDTTIAVRFSQPLDPRTVLGGNFRVELVSVATPIPLPFSVFLAQQRLGKCEVLLTPINPLPANGTIRVTVTKNVEDLLGQQMPQSTISFFTGIATTPVVLELDEQFNDVGQMDSLLTTANWNRSRPYVGGVAGECTASFAPYAGDGTDDNTVTTPDGTGADGDFIAEVGINTTIDTGGASHRVFNFRTFTVPLGARLVVTGAHPLVIHCQGAVDVSGIISLDASNGGNGFRGDEATGSVTGGAGGTAGPGGGAGGAGAMAVQGAGGNFDGVNGTGTGGGKGGFTGEQDHNYTTSTFWPRTTYLGSPQTCSNPTFSYEPCRQREGGGGGSFETAGTGSDNTGATLLVRDGASLPNGGAAGATYGSATFSGASTAAVVEVLDPDDLPNTRTVTLSGIPTLVVLDGGSGGGGGGGEDDATAGNVLTESYFGVPDGSDEGGGGGGGGGGALQIVTYGNMSVSGSISAKGGTGGGSYDDGSLSTFSQGAGGGGGSGGAVWLQCHGAMTIVPGATMDVSGGAGGRGRADGSTTVYTAGSGGSGRVRLEDSDGTVANAPSGASTGTFIPTLDLDSAAYSAWQNTGFVTPNFEPLGQDALGVDDVIAAILPTAADGYIRIYLEGAPEDVTVNTASDNPDEALSTGWVLIYDTDQGGVIAGNPQDALDNNKWWRFRIDFHVDALHSFSDPMPTVRRLRIHASQ